MENEESIRAQIAGLSLQATVSRSERLDFDNLTRESLVATMERMRKTMSKYVERASATTGHRYHVECGEWRTRSKDIVVTVIVSRDAA